MLLVRYCSRAGDRPRSSTSRALRNRSQCLVICGIPHLGPLRRGEPIAPDIFGHLFPPFEIACGTSSNVAACRIRGLCAQRFLQVAMRASEFFNDRVELVPRFRIKPGYPTRKNGAIDIGGIRQCLAKALRANNTDHAARVPGSTLKGKNAENSFRIRMEPS